jgi:hypothetical protein
MIVMVDANQKWGVNQAIEWMNELAEFKLHWIEEPTSCDDILGHLKISQALAKHGNDAIKYFVTCRENFVVLGFDRYIC